MWHIAPEITDEMTKKIKRREIMRKYLRISSANSATDMQDIITCQTQRVREISLVYR